MTPSYQKHRIFPFPLAVYPATPSTTYFSKE